MEVGSPLLEDQGSGLPWPGPSKNRTTNHYSSFVGIGRNSSQSVNKTINYQNFFLHFERFGNSGHYVYNYAVIND